MKKFYLMLSVVAIIGLNMKKFYLMLSVVAIIGFAVVPAQALVGMPDAVPGSQTLVPFWLVDIDFDGADTLVVLTEVGGVPKFVDPGVGVPAGNLHLQVYTVRSSYIFDANRPYTKYDVVGFQFGQLLTQYAPGTLPSFEIDLDNDGTNDHYAGYAVVTDTAYGPDRWGGQINSGFEYDFNHWIAHLYLLDLKLGQSAGVTIPVRESEEHVVCASAMNNGPYERYHANAYNMIQQVTLGDDSCEGAGSFRFMPRYYIDHEVNGRSHFILWQSTNPQHPVNFPSGGMLHLNWYDEEEHSLSSVIYIDNEVNFINCRTWLPEAISSQLHPAPWGGWFDMNFPTVFHAPTNWDFDTEMVGYSWQNAAAADASANFSVLFDVHRDAGTS